MSGAALEFRGLSLGYDHEPVVYDVDMTVEPGEFVALVGPNGAGKTTLLRGVSDASLHRGGCIEVFGDDVAGLDARRLARNVGVLPQTVTVDQPFTGYEFVSMGRHASRPRFGAEREIDRKAVQDALRMTGTEESATRPVTSLSGGDLQRLALAQALAQEPGVLLLDEPTSHLDLNHRLQILDLCRGLADGGMAVFGVFHDLEMAARYGDRIAVLSGGRLVADGRPKEVLQPGLIADVFKVRAVVSMDPATGAPSMTALLREDDVSPDGRGKVVVVGGSGSASWLVRRLVLDGWETSLAAIPLGDTDQAVAEVLGVEAVCLEPFGSVDEESGAKVLEMMEAADAVVVASTPFGRANIENLRAARDASVPTILVGGMDGRDFTSGEATEVWESIAVRARVVDDAEGAIGALEEMIQR